MTETGSDESGNPDFCEVPQSIQVNGGFVSCDGRVDPTLEHLDSLQAISFRMPDYRPNHDNSFVAIVDGREEGPVSKDDWRQLVEAVVEYDDDGVTKMAMLGHVCCPRTDWYEEYPDDFGDLASYHCQNAFGDGNLYPNAYCLPVPDAAWPHNGVTLNQSIPPTGGLCVYQCFEDSDCPGYGLGLHFCDSPMAQEDMSLEWNSPFDQWPIAGVCRNNNYPLVPSPLSPGEPLKARLERDITF